MRPFEASLREAPRDEDSSLLPSITYLMLRSAPFETPPAAAPQDKRARLEARTALLRLIFSALTDFVTASFAGMTGDVQAQGDFRSSS